MSVLNDLDTTLARRFGRKVRWGGALELARFSRRREDSSRPESPGRDGLPGRPKTGVDIRFTVCETWHEQMFDDGRHETIESPGPGPLRPGLPSFLGMDSRALLRPVRGERVWK